MKNLIYQCWAGELRDGCKYSQKLFQEYADRIGADYRLDVDPNIAGKLCDVPMYFEWLNPICDDSFLEYDNVLTVDMDVFPVDGLTENIFDIDIGHLGVCTEPFQGKYRESTSIGGSINKANDERWANAVTMKWGCDMPRDEDGYLTVYNAGMVVFSNEGMMQARNEWVPFQEYINYMRGQGLGRFYTVDQNYMHAMMCATKCNYTTMDNGWNHYVHEIRGPLAFKYPHGINDSRDGWTRFVHCQLSGGDYFSDEKLYNITNKPIGEWVGT